MVVVQSPIAVTGGNGGQARIDGQEGFSKYLVGFAGNHQPSAAPLQPIS